MRWCLFLCTFLLLFLFLLLLSFFFLSFCLFFCFFFFCFFLSVLRALALEEFDKHYPAASWTHIYTDGSAENATKNGGCGAYIKRPSKAPFSVLASGGILRSNYRAEVLALLNVTESIISREEKPKKSVFLTNSLSALPAITSGEPDTTQKKLTENTSTLAQTTCVFLQWIPAHTGIRRNEIADQLAK